MRAHKSSSQSNGGEPIQKLMSEIMTLHFHKKNLIRMTFRLQRIALQTIFQSVKTFIHPSITLVLQSLLQYIYLVEISNTNIFHKLIFSFHFP